jgi:Phage integrase, N-terminal SAM-like domain
MATTITSAALVPAAPVFTNTERLALAGSLAGYSGLTRQAYELDLRQFTSWCQRHRLRLFQARRADIECFARDLEARGRARATITRRLCTVAGFYRYAVEEELLDHSPAAHVRRPGWMTSRTPPGWTITSWARCWSPLGSDRQRSMRCRHGQQSHRYLAALDNPGSLAGAVTVLQRGLLRIRHP